MPIRGKPANSLTLSTLANVRNPLIDDLPDDASDLGDDCKPKIKKNNTVNNKRNSNEYRIHHRLSDHNEVSHEQELLELYEEQELEHNQKRRSESELQEQESEEEEECKRLRQCHEENARSMSFLENSGLECSFGRDFMHSESVSNDNYCLNRNSYNTNGNYSILNSSVDRKANKIAIDAVLAATQHFVHIMQMHELNSFFAVRDGASREENVKKQLSTKSTNEMHSIIMAFVEILEDLRIERGKLALLTGIPALEDNMPEERMMSASLFSTMSTASLSRPPVHETHEVAMSRDKQGNMMINRYIILANLGQGAYGKVKLGEDIDTGKQVAIKIISKKHLKKKIGSSNAGEASDALNREIAIMKKVRHKNCVSLYEVIDDPVSQRLYLIMDYIPNGPVVRVQHQRVLPIFLAEVEAERVVDGIKYNRELVRCLVHHDASAGKVALSSSQMEQRPSLFMCKPLKQRLCANYLRQLVSGLRYMHKRNVVHHDIKPDNILLGYDHHVYLTDFGVSEIMETESNDEDNNNNNGYSVGNKSITTSTQDALSKNANDALSDNMRESQKHNGPTTNTTTVNTTSVGKCTTKTTSQRCDRGARLGGGTLLFTAPEFFSSSFANASSTSERVNNPSTNNKVENEKEQHKQEKQNINTSKEEHKEEKENNNDNDKIVGSNLIDPFATDVWALGVTLYCMLVGCAPFNGNVYPEVVRSITTQDIPWNNKNLHSEPLLPHWLTILRGLLQKVPKERWNLDRLKMFLDSRSFQAALRTVKESDNNNNNNNSNSNNDKSDKESYRRSTKSAKSKVKRNQSKKHMSEDEVNVEGVVGLEEELEELEQEEEEGNAAVGSESIEKTSIASFAESDVDEDEDDDVNDDDDDDDNTSNGLQHDNKDTNVDEKKKKNKGNKKKKDNNKLTYSQNANKLRSTPATEAALFSPSTPQLDPIGVSEKEVREAMTRMKVEVVTRPTFRISAHTKEIVHRFVSRIQRAHEIRCPFTSFTSRVSTVERRRHDSLDSNSSYGSPTHREPVVNIKGNGCREISNSNNEQYHAHCSPVKNKTTATDSANPEVMINSGRASPEMKPSHKPKRLIVSEVEKLMENSAESDDMYYRAVQAIREQTEQQQQQQQQRKNVANGYNATTTNKKNNDDNSENKNNNINNYQDNNNEHYYDEENDEESPRLFECPSWLRPIQENALINANTSASNLPVIFASNAINNISNYNYHPVKANNSNNNISNHTNDNNNNNNTIHNSVINHSYSYNDKHYPVQNANSNNNNNNKVNVHYAQTNKNCTDNHKKERVMLTSTPEENDLLNEYGFFDKNININAVERHYLESYANKINNINNNNNNNNAIKAFEELGEQSLDAVLSIVNLQSTSGTSVSLSLSSSMFEQFPERNMTSEISPKYTTSGQRMSVSNGTHSGSHQRTRVASNSSGIDPNNLVSKVENKENNNNTKMNIDQAQALCVSGINKSKTNTVDDITTIHKDKENMSERWPKSESVPTAMPLEENDIVAMSLESNSYSNKYNALAKYSEKGFNNAISKDYSTATSSVLCNLVSPSINTLISSADFIEKNCTASNAKKLESNDQVIHTSTQSGTSSSNHDHPTVTTTTAAANAVVTSFSSNNINRSTNNKINVNISGNSIKSSPNMKNQTIIDNINSVRTSKESVNVVEQISLSEKYKSVRETKLASVNGDHESNYTNSTPERALPSRPAMLNAPLISTEELSPSLSLEDATDSPKLISTTRLLAPLSAVEEVHNERASTSVAVKEKKGHSLRFLFNKYRRKTHNIMDLTEAKENVEAM